MKDMRVLFASVPNLVIELRDEVFKDPILTGALVDRLAHIL
jgi:hypothetical protein